MEKVGTVRGYERREVGLVDVREKVIIAEKKTLQKHASSLPRGKAGEK